MSGTADLMPSMEHSPVAHSTGAPAGFGYGFGQVDKHATAVHLIAKRKRIPEMAC